MAENNSKTEVVQEIDELIKYICKGLRNRENKEAIFTDDHLVKVVATLASLVEARTYLDKGEPQPLYIPCHDVGSVQNIYSNRKRR